jgi:hypothetical protein
MLEYAGKFDGISLYLTKNADPTEVFERHEDLLQFVSIVLDLGSKVFGLDVSALHIYHGSEQKIAFNRSNSLFFNISVYFRDQRSGRVSLSEHRVYWYFVFCHEVSLSVFSGVFFFSPKNFFFGNKLTIPESFNMQLAHCFISEHDMRHEHFLCDFGEKYLPDLMRLLLSTPVR